MVLEAGLEEKSLPLEEKFRRPLNSGIVQLEVNSNSRLSALRPRIRAMVRRRKTQARSMTAVTVVETRLRLWRGSLLACISARKEERPTLKPID